MKRSKFAEEQIAYTLGRVDGGMSLADACR